MDEMNGNIKSLFKEGWLQATISLVGIIVVVANLYLASKLTPLVSDIDSLKFRIRAVEGSMAKGDSQANDLIPRFIIVEQKVNDMHDRIIRIENKIDNFIP